VELGGAGWPEAMRRNGMVGRRMEGDGADRRAPHGSDVREREGVSPGVRKVKENTPFSKYTNVAWVEWAERGAGGVQGVAGRRGLGFAGWAEI
jgi:hypothetical protein